MTYATKNGHIRPKLVYPYVPLKESVHRLLQKPGIQSQLELWRKRIVPDDTMGDIYDGRVWRDFRDRDNSKFFEQQNRLGFILNVDWFQPFSRTEASVGALYLAIANLPREIRYHPENVCLLGIMPGGKEAALSQMNEFLAPIVDDLLDFSRMGRVAMSEANRPMPDDDPRRQFSRCENWRRGWDSHHCRLLETKNLTDVSFSTNR